MHDMAQEPAGRRSGTGIARLPTGAKVFLILSAALLPFALIVFFTTFQATRAARVEAQARLDAAAGESSGFLRGFLTGQTQELRDALFAIESAPEDSPACSRLSGVFAAISGARFAIVERRGTLLCGEQLAFVRSGVLKPGEVRASIGDGNNLVLAVGGLQGGVGVAMFPRSTLDLLSRPSGFLPDYGLSLQRGEHRLTLHGTPDSRMLSQMRTVKSDLNLDGLSLSMSMAGPSVIEPLLIAMLVPLLMWIASAGGGWFVVDRLLIRPLRRLRANVDAGPMPAQEIRDLGESFRMISDTVREHESDLAEGLVRQTRLTREVHHRVKNNLQVIASLINFHARSATGPEAAEAYASIQRRVDALAVVHRHHYAELEESNGLELRSVIGELASNIRATAAPESARMGITLELEPFLVTQDVAVAVAFLLTEIVELAIKRNPAAQIRISAHAAADEPGRAVLRVVSPALVGTPEMEAMVEERYGRVMGGLARQLRSKLHYDSLIGAYEARIAVNNRR